MIPIYGHMAMCYTHIWSCWTYYRVRAGSYHKCVIPIFGHMAMCYTHIWSCWTYYRVRAGSYHVANTSWFCVHHACPCDGFVSIGGVRPGWTRHHRWPAHWTRHHRCPAHWTQHHRWPTHWTRHRRCPLHVPIDSWCQFSLYSVEQPSRG